MRHSYTFFQFTLAFLLFSTATGAQTEAEITRAVLQRDSLFWEAYNHCDNLAFEDFLTKDVEFFHDKGGVTLGAENLANSIRNNICGNPNQKVRRVPIKGTKSCYPMRDGDKIYGVIVSEDHQFFVTEPGAPEYSGSIAKATALWLFEDGKWKMGRVLSYDHH